MGEVVLDSNTFCFKGQFYTVQYKTPKCVCVFIKDVRSLSSHIFMMLRTICMA